MYEYGNLISMLTSGLYSKSTPLFVMSRNEKSGDTATKSSLLSSCMMYTPSSQNALNGFSTGSIFPTKLATPFISFFLPYYMAFIWMSLFCVPASTKLHRNVATVPSENQDQLHAVRYFRSPLRMFLNCTIRRISAL